MMNLESSGTVHGSSHYITADSQPRNPYARTPSRRAIACVTCAKAKTKCNKTVPACSRCITKGILCEPRSTRRTSENKHRSNIRKQQPTLPNKHHSTNGLAHCDQSKSSCSSPPSEETIHMRSMSYDCNNVAKTDEQTLVLSGYPMLSPLPTDTLYTTNESQSSSDDFEKNLVGLEHTISNSNLSSLGGLSPQTPEPMVFHEPLPMNCMDYSSYPQSWCEEVSASVECGFGSTVTHMIAPEIWTMPSTAIPVPSTSHTQWPQPDLTFQLPQMQAARISYPDDTCAYSRSQSSSDGCFSSPVSDWRIFEPAGAEISNAASASFLLNMQSGWEDGFICEPSSYQGF